MKELAGQLTSRLESAISALSEERFRGLYDTFNFTSTGNNLCHSLTVGLLAGIVRELDEVAYVGIDVRLNTREGVKFQPDLVGFKEGLAPAIYVDFESPNSSDARVPDKDVKAYLAWTKGNDEWHAPYVVVTSLPNCLRSTSEWKLRWTAAGQCNSNHKGKRNAVCTNPFRYWTQAWAKELRRTNLVDVLFINIDRRSVRTFRIA